MFNKWKIEASRADRFLLRASWAQYALSCKASLGFRSCPITVENSTSWILAVPPYKIRCLILSRYPLTSRRRIPRGGTRFTQQSRFPSSLFLPRIRSHNPTNTSFIKLSMSESSHSKLYQLFWPSHIIFPRWNPFLRLAWLKIAVWVFSAVLLQLTSYCQ